MPLTFIYELFESNIFNACYFRSLNVPLTGKILAINNEMRYGSKSCSNLPNFFMYTSSARPFYSLFLFIENRVTNRTIFSVSGSTKLSIIINYSKIKQSNQRYSHQSGYVTFFILIS